MTQEILVCREDDFYGWLAKVKNPDRLPVVQYQTPQHPAPVAHLGGWVLQKPTADDWKAIPLHVHSEREAIAEARKLNLGDV
ncbi:hypothetical protein P3H80_01140 [Mycolicibacterium septicum]|uniref:hypothetical protein n=1 Tax=Mycolicibacterium septicum TaxID=98668 RepID=UPI0023E115F9|nr:hypothetical protein [Mycolicibacterium septicum]MDF3336003.1 hypothetical protein [Mycolicibacterium septicum]